MATSKLSTYVEGEDLDENKATVKPGLSSTLSVLNASLADNRAARRLYLFQRPLQGHESLSTMSEATQTRGNYTSAAGDPRVDSVLPQITESFHIISHIGVIVIEEAVYADESLTALQKLSTGLVYEHAGPSMRSSQEGAGIHVNEVAIQTFTALDFIGHTDLTNARLDTICETSARARAPQSEQNSG
ncbi:hypothetical protein N7494_000957 [Penicillium frequentans]|uniref:Uncharacterized protein n=1 Tax=Penicillium frequentans TaxID=3151616 RepID=A0AAD6GM34_9EURO|nr:hypothetical protein N7494_000957 [Penicillium glabrum]